MTLYEHVSISHETSTSESEGGGEAVETTLKVLAAMKSVQNSLDPLSPASKKSRAEQSSLKIIGRTADFKSSQDEAASQNSQPKNALNHATLSSVTESTGPPKNSVGHYPFGIAPLQPSNNRTQQLLQQQQQQQGTKKGGLFSCCFRANEQVLVAEPPVREASVHNSSSNKSNAYPAPQEAASKSGSQEKEREQEEGGNKEEVPGNQKELTDYERAMIQRLRELLSLDTSVPTLPTHIQVVTKQGGSPVSLDITDSMIANTFSIDTKELQQVLQADPTNTLGEIKARVEAESVQSKGSQSRAKSQKSAVPLAQNSSSTVEGIQHPPSVQSSTKHTADGRNKAAAAVVSSAASLPARTRPVKMPTPRLVMSQTQATQALQRKQSGISQSRSTVGIPEPDTPKSRGAPPQSENASTTLRSAPSNVSKTSKATSHLSRKGTSVVGRQPSMSEQPKTLIQKNGIVRIGSSSVVGNKGVPPKPETDISRNNQEAMFTLKKSSSIKSGSTASNKSKKSLASQMHMTRSGSSYQRLKTQSDSKISSTSSRDMSVMPDMPMSDTTGLSSMRRTKSSKSTSSSSAASKSTSFKSTTSASSNQPSLRYISSVSSPRHILHHQRSSNVSSADETRHEIEESRFHPPRPEVARKRKDAMEAIVAASSNTQREEPEENGNVECIYPLDDTDAQEDPPELQAAHSAELVLRAKLKAKTENMRRTTSEIVRIGPIQPIRRSLSRESSTVLGEAILDDNNNASPEDGDAVPKTASNLLVRAPKDIRDDISDLGMLSPKRMAVAAVKAQQQQQQQGDNIMDEKENAGAGGGTVVPAAEPRKMDVLDMFSSGFFCLGGTENAANTVI